MWKRYVDSDETWLTEAGYWFWDVLPGIRLVLQQHKEAMGEPRHAGLSVFISESLPGEATNLLDRPSPHRLMAGRLREVAGQLDKIADVAARAVGKASTPQEVSP